MLKVEQISKEIETCEGCKRIFSPEIRKRGCTFYANRLDGYKFMMVLQNPLYNRKRHIAEKSEADRALSFNDRVRVHQRFFHACM